jgi:O-antigen/teichoic acid export membrane protein
VDDHPRKIARRVSWSLVDQAFSSASNFALAICVARSVEPDGFGAFGVTLALYSLIVGAARAATSEPFLVRHNISAPSQTDGAAGASGTSLLLGLALGPVVVLGGYLSGPATRLPVMVLGCLVPALLVQDGWRYILIARGRPKAAAAIDGLWLVLQGLGSAVLLSNPAAPKSSSVWIGVWGLAATGSAVAGGVLCRTTPSVRLTLRWLLLSRRYVWRFLLEYAVTLAVPPLTLIVLGAANGLSDAASIRGAQTVYSPIALLSLGLGVTLTPECSRLARRSRRLVRRLVGVAGLGVVLASGITALLLLSISPTIGHWIIGASWDPASRLIGLYAVAVAAAGVALAAVAGLRGLEEIGLSLRCRLATAPAVLVLPLAGAHVAGATGYAAGAAAATSAQAAVFVWAVLRSTSSGRMGPSPSIGVGEPAVGAINLGG